MSFTIIKGDITKVDFDIVVNSANTKLRRGCNVCGAIFKAAGVRELRKACKEIRYCQTGEAVITPGFKLSKYIIHTAAPKWDGGNNSELVLLKRCYENSLKLAVKCNCDSIVFPLISAGKYGFPKEVALKIATETITEFLTKSGSEMNVSLILRED